GPAPARPPAAAAAGPGAGRSSRRRARSPEVRARPSRRRARPPGRPVSGCRIRRPGRAGSRRPAVTMPGIPEVLSIGQPRLTGGLDRLKRLDLTAYRAAFGPAPTLAPGRLIEMAEQVDLRGRGGAAFPVARKLRAVQGSAQAR